MSDDPKNGDATSPFGLIRLDEAVSWAGACPAGFAYGTENGRVFLSDVEARQRYTLPDAKPLGEPVNGVAFFEKLVAVSTRSCIAFHAVDRGKGKRGLFGGGAYGIIASPSGYCAGAMGPTGLMWFKPTTEQKKKQIVKVIRPADELVNFYKVISLLGTTPELLVCALRTHGLAIVRTSNEDEKHGLSRCRFRDFDAVDVCQLDPSGNPRAVAALGSDGTIVLFRDVLEGPAPTILKYQQMTGTAYSLLSVRGSLFLLTDSRLYVIADLSAKFLAGQRVNSTSALVRPVRMEAVDAGLVGDEWILIVLDSGEVLRVDVAAIIGDPQKEIEVEGVIGDPEQEMGAIESPQDFSRQEEEVESEELVTVP